MCDKILKNCGINRIIVYYSHRRYYVQVEINFTKAVLKDEEKLFHISEENIDIFASRVDSMFKKVLNIELPPILEWKPKRIDYAIDIVTEDIGIYISLIKNSRIYRPKFCQSRIYETSVYQMYRTYRLNIYDKEEERANTKPVEIDKYKNLLKIEVQSDKEKLKYLQRKYKLKERKLLHYLNQEIALDLIINYLEKSIGKVDHYKYSVAVAIVDCAPINKKLKTSLKKTLNIIYNQRNLNDVIDSYKNTITIKRQLKILNDIGINPLLLPDDCTKEVLPNLIKLINEGINK